MRVDDSSAQRQVLVMLRLPPPHFRPDVDYAGGYDSRVGRDARRRIAEGLANQYELRIIDDWPMPALGVDCFVMETQSTSSIARLVEKLSLDPRVESAQSMNLFHVLGYNDPLYPLQPAAKSWHLADIHRITTGKNVRVAEIDTGVEVAHPDLIGRIALSRNFVDPRTEVAEVHGTAVAGIIAATGNNGVGIVGIAPEARLMVLRACWETSGRVDPAVCSSFTLAKALQFALGADAQWSTSALADRATACSSGCLIPPCRVVLPLLAPLIPASVTEDSLRRTVAFLPSLAMTRTMSPAIHYEVPDEIFRRQSWTESGASLAVRRLPRRM
jgi:hypothetical protein